MNFIDTPSLFNRRLLRANALATTYLETGILCGDVSPNIVSNIASDTGGVVCTPDLELDQTTCGVGISGDADERLFDSGSLFGPG